MTFIECNIYQSPRCYNEANVTELQLQSVDLKFRILSYSGESAVTADYLFDAVPDGVLGDVSLVGCKPLSFSRHQKDEFVFACVSQKLRPLLLNLGVEPHELKLSSSIDLGVV